MELLGDLLGGHTLPGPLVTELCSACLGNPGLLQRFLEMAQGSGALVYQDGRWTHPEGLPLKVEMQEDRVQSLLAGRLLRVNPAALALVRYLALADAPLALGTLGRVLGLDGDAVAEALAALVSAKLALVSAGRARLASAQVRELALAKMASGEVSRCARLLLKMMEQEGGKPVLSVRLQAYALDPATALAQVLEAIEQERPGPRSAQRILEEALTLEPSPAQQARLWEFLADNWRLATEGDWLPVVGAQPRSPSACALEALNGALLALGAIAGAPGDALGARLQRKKGLLELRLRRFPEAAQTLAEASRLLADHPFHPEQPRLCLALGRQLRLQGQGGKGLKLLEEGLRLLGPDLDGASSDQIGLLLELGRTQGERGLFQGALATLQSARRLLEAAGEFSPGSRVVAPVDDRKRVEVQVALAAVYLNLGQTAAAEVCLLEAMALARVLDDGDRIASCHLGLGILASAQQQMGPALAHLESALRRFTALDDQAMASQAQAWKGRTLAALGDPVLAELLFLQASVIPVEALTPLERGERAFLEGEITAFKGAWGDAARHYQAACNRFEEAGLSWREHLARLRGIQAQARSENGLTVLKSAWIRLEGLKGPVESSGSRWLELEWHRGHALLLSLSGPGEDVLAAALAAWGEVLAGARDLSFPALVLEASARAAELLLARGEPRVASLRIQDGAAAFQELWSRLPEAFETSFLQRPDLNLFRTAVENAGMPFTLPDRGDPLADWIPTQANLPWVPFSRVKP